MFREQLSPGMITQAKPTGRQRLALLDEAQKEAVLAYCKIAGASGALLSLKDLVELLALDATEEELESFISTDKSLGSKVFVQSGHVLMRQPGGDRESAREATENEERRKQRAIANVEAASTFARPLVEDAVMVAVAGTNSYLSAAEDDDIDFYCITRTDDMWTFMLKALILSRVSAGTRKSAPPFCFSFVLDQRRAKEELSRPKDALFARDTLTAKVISGKSAYHRLLEWAPWMGTYFPSLYGRRLRESDPAGPPLTARRGSRVVNSFLFLTVGSYVSLRAWVLNRKLAKEGRLDEVFVTKIGPDRLEYMSRRYAELGKLYQPLQKR